MSFIPSEVWASIPGYSMYEVSNLGRVRSFKGKTERLLKLEAKKSNYATYYRAHLTNDDGKTRKVRVHLLVLEAFVGKRPSEEHKACHIDGNSLNNWVWNLKWGTAVENEADKIVHGRKVFGTAIHCAKLYPEAVRRIRRLHAKGWNSAIINKLVRDLGVTRTTIMSVIKGKTWSWVV